MRNIKMLVLIFSLLSLVLLSADNYMELIWEQQGEHDEAEYGYSIAAIDFNGDNIDDLVVGSYDWNTGGVPTNEYPGKIYFYFGGDDFDNIPELTVDGTQYHNQTALGYHLVNLGDVNGDGYEDLGSKRAGDWQIIRYYLEIYYGGPDCDTIPDFQHITYMTDISGLYSFYPLGDVNGDGYDDAGYVVVTQETDVNQYYIIYGGETPQVEYWNTIGSGGVSIREIGNINNDEYDDFMIGFMDIETQFRHNVIFYGDTIIDTLIIDTLYTQTVYPIDTGGAYAGDFNGDGTDDFIGCWSTENGTALWFGSIALSSEPDVFLPSYCSAYGHDGKCFGFGDLNNDGYSDLVLGSPLWSNHQGKAYFYIGDEYANGSIDLDIPAPLIVGSQFGTSVAIGDFNNDGFDDAAIGAPAPYSGWYPGYVYVYSGNDSLEETTPVSVNEITSIPGITFNAYPNPFNPTVTFEIKAEDYDNLQIEIFNVKGQKVHTLNIENLILNNKKIVWNAEAHPSGVYFCKLISVETEKILSVKKVTLLK